MSPATAQQASTQPVLLLVGGPAGAGKSTVSRAWCRTRQRAVCIDLDEVRDLIVAGRADPQVLTHLQAEQYQTSVRACIALARVFLNDGYDVALETVFEPDDFAQRWRPVLAGLPWHLVVLRLRCQSHWPAPAPGQSGSWRSTPEPNTNAPAPGTPTSKSTPPTCR